LKGRSDLNKWTGDEFQ